MKKNQVHWLFILLLSSVQAMAQQQGNLSESSIDTTRQKALQAIVNKYEYVNISGYIQPQFQIGETPGQRSFNGGDLPAGVESRFSVRRGRLRIDYAHFDAQKRPTVLFVFQFDGTERGMQTRDFWGRFYEHKLDLFHVTAGLFARPFGFEVNYGSGDRESPERGRMSQLLMRTERDLGAMLTFEPRNPTHPLRFLKVDAGLFNGPGLASVSDYDGHKDFISRLTVKPQLLGKSGVQVTGSVSGYWGGIGQFTNDIYRMNGSADSPAFVVDGTVVSPGTIAPRRYYGADLQVRIPNRRGRTEFRAEYIQGTQTANKASTETPGVVPNPVSAPTASPLYVRQFSGAYFYYLQHLGSEKHQFVAKYDWYDPNTQVAGKQIDGKFGWADIRYNTLGLGYLYYVNSNLKLVLWYDIPVNESTNLPGYENDVPDNLLTVRTQYRF
ncbi:porin [Fibrella forsythiae]|uniref:Porin n=1 Tax=Fibrella forsythiae TaxID=2817061 RepID=A0ABS3JKU9_9BACT|nr:porin [Fibrella forsythiae]MBO0949844.1 porin [Fibrella forsythiae]